MHKQESVWENETQSSLGFWHTDGSPNPDQKTRPWDDWWQKKKKGYCRLVDFAMPADHRVKIKENEKRNKDLDLSEEEKNGSWLWWWYQW